MLVFLTTITMEYYAAVRKDKILSFVSPWKDLENIRLKEIKILDIIKFYIIAKIFFKQKVWKEMEGIPWKIIKKSKDKMGLFRENAL